jgi:hypothetical protein
MLKFFGRFGPSSVLLLYVLNWLLKLKYVLYASISDAPFNVAEMGLLRFPSIADWAIKHPTYYTILSIHIIFGIALLVNQFWRIEKIIPKNAILPALSIIITSSLLPAGFLYSINTFLFLLLIIILILIFSSQTSSGATARLFRAGILMGCVLMLKPVMIFVLIATIVVVTIFKSIDGRSILAYVLGTIMPIVVFYAVLWLLSPGLIAKIGTVNFTLPRHFTQLENLILSIVVISWFVVHAYFIKQNKSEIGGIYVQKKWLSLRVIWIAVFCSAIFSNTVPSFSFFIWINFSALLLFQCFNMVLNKKWANFTFVFLILVILINQYVFF